MKKTFFIFLVFALIFQLIMPLSFADTTTDTEESPVNWIDGPTTVQLEDMGSIALGENYSFLNKADTVIAMEYFENPSTNAELGSVFPKSEDENWFIVFEYYEDGHVDDKDKNIDANELLTSMKDATVEGNKEREQLGMTPLNLIGWAESPNYNEELHSLVWCTRNSSKDDKGNDYISLNYQARVLTRLGYIAVTLVCSEEELELSKEHLKVVLSALQLAEGKRYEDYVPGTDKVSDYGLAALIAGGAAVATKKGFLIALLLGLKKFWIIIFVAIGGFLKTLLGRKKRADIPEPAAPPEHNYEQSTATVYDDDNPVYKDDDL